MAFHPKTLHSTISEDKNLHQNNQRPQGFIAIFGAFILGLKSEDRSRKSEVRSQESEVGSRKTGVKNKRRVKQNEFNLLTLNHLNSFYYGIQI